MSRELCKCYFCNRLQKYLFQALRFKVKNKGVNGHNSSQEDLKMLMKLCGQVCPLFLRVYFAHSATLQNGLVRLVKTPKLGQSHIVKQIFFSLPIQESILKLSQRNIERNRKKCLLNSLEFVVSFKDRKGDASETIHRMYFVCLSVSLWDGKKASTRNKTVNQL